MTLAVFGENTPAVAIALPPEESARPAVGFTLTITWPIVPTTEDVVVPGDVTLS